MQLKAWGIIISLWQNLLNFFFQPLVLIMILSLTIGLWRGGRLSELAELISLKKWELILTAFLIQCVLATLGEKGLTFLIWAGPPLHILSYVLLLIVIWYNRPIKGFLLIGVGIFLNFVVILANGGHMPVWVEGAIQAKLKGILPLLQSKTYVLHSALTEQTRLKFLSDIIVLPPPYPRPKVLSPGDIIMAAGLFILIQQWMLKKDSGKV